MAASQATQLADPGTKLVLLVEDDEGLLDLLVFAASREGFRTDFAADGLTAVTKAARNPDLIVLDLLLPELGGYEVIRELQRQDRAGLPIMVVTGHPLDPASLDALRFEPNVRGIFQKPLSVKALTFTFHYILKTRPPRPAGAGQPLQLINPRVSVAPPRPPAGDLGIPL